VVRVEPACSQGSTVIKNGYTLNERKFNTDQPVFFPHCCGIRAIKRPGSGSGIWAAFRKAFDYFRILNGQGEYYNPDPDRPCRYDPCGRICDRYHYATDRELAERAGYGQAPFFPCGGGEGLPHREWLPEIFGTSGPIDDREIPFTSDFFHDNYEGRQAAADQDMTIARERCGLREDLKVHADYEHSGIYKPLYAGAEKSRSTTINENKVSREFDSRRDTGGSAAALEVPALYKGLFVGGRVAWTGISAGCSSTWMRRD